MGNKRVSDFNCDMCKKKRNCKELCPPIEYYAKQDEVSQREKPKAMENIIPAKFPESQSTAEIIFQLFFFNHKSQQEIVELLTVSKQYVSITIRKQLKIVAQNLSKKL